MKHRDGSKFLHQPAGIQGRGLTAAGERRKRALRLARKKCVEPLPSVHHRVARVRAELRAGVGRAELLAALLPSGSVTGAPKQSAMRIIAELEAERRGLYTGGFGSLSHDGGLTLAMAIRTLVIHDGQGAYWVGGGIVADSDPERELEETLWKAAQLARVASTA